MIKRGHGLGIAVALAAIAWEPNAHAAEPKRVVALLVALITMAFAWAEARRAPRALPWSAKLALGFVALSALTSWWGLPSGWLDLATWIGAATCAAAAARAGHASAIRAARTAALLVSAFVSAWTLGAVIGGERGFSIHAGQGNPNWLGLLLAMTLPLTLESAVLHVQERGARDPRAIALTMLAALQPAALYASHSRVGWASAVVALAWLSWNVRGARRALRIGARTLALAAVLTGAVVAREHAPRTTAPVFAARLAAPPLRAARVEASPEDVPAARSLDGRVWMGAQSLRAVRGAGLFGVGLGGFGHAYLEAQGASLAHLDVRAAARRFVNPGTAHDDLLQVAIESGPLALMVLVGALVCALWELRRSRWHAAGALVLAFAVCMLGDSPLRQPAPCMLLALVVASLRGKRQATHLSASDLRARRALWMVPILAVITCSLVVSTRAWLSTRELEAAKVASPEARLSHYTRATRVDPTSGDALLALGIEELFLGRPDDALAHLEEARRLVATVAARVAVGEALLAKELDAEARDALRAALVWSPGSVRARVAMAEAERRLGHLDQAEQHAKAARALSPGDPRVMNLETSLREVGNDAEIEIASDRGASL